MKDIYKFLFDQIDYIGDTIKNVEQNIFKGKEKEMVISISIIARNMLNFKRVIYPHKILWLNLIENGKEMFGKNFEKDAKNIFDELERLILEIEHISKMVDELRDTNNSILSTRQNETMKTFTILAFLTLPLSLVASLFGMNSENMPIMGMKYDFWIILGMMFCIGIALFMYFKYKKWI
jgi:magnesium transporter